MTTHDLIRTNSVAAFMLGPKAVMATRVSSGGILHTSRRIANRGDWSRGIDAFGGVELEWPSVELVGGLQ